MIAVLVVVALIVVVVVVVVVVVGGGNTTDEEYTSGDLEIPLDVLQEEMRTRMAFKSLAGTSTSVPLSPSLSEEETLYSCVVLWREVFDGNHPLTVDEFLYCYKPSEISQSLGFYQFSTRGLNCRLVKSLPTFDRKWKMEFFFVYGF
ncbi:hypothetical protein SO802_017754 [Lithocarpus litseifolius]|uniref:Uncharacterized protein n=1 Tax=Lithocarpus litseifolius TaxID=425828 RepID=A0AAW2CJE1_9ROSI